MPFETIKNQAGKIKQQAEEANIKRKLDANFNQRVKVENLRVNELNRIQELQSNRKMFNDELEGHVVDAIQISTDFVVHFDHQIDKINRENHELVQLLNETANDRSEMNIVENNKNHSEIDIEDIPKEIKEFLKDVMGMDIEFVDEDESTDK